MSYIELCVLTTGVFSVMQVSHGAVGVGCHTLITCVFSVMQVSHGAVTLITCVFSVMQVSHGAVGVCCQTLSEAEAIVYGGGTGNVLVSNQVCGMTGLPLHSKNREMVENTGNLKILENHRENPGNLKI